MNKWQQVYCDMYHNGKMPKNKQEKANVELLGKIKSKVVVEFPDFNGINGFKPAHTETFIVTENECSMLNGKVSVDALVSNLKLWHSKGYKVTTL